MQFLYSNSFLLLGLTSKTCIAFKEFKTVLQGGFVNLSKCSFPEFFDKFCSEWVNFAPFQNLNVIDSPNFIKNNSCETWLFSFFKTFKTYVEMIFLR